MRGARESETSDKIVTFSNLYCFDHMEISCRRFLGGGFGLVAILIASLPAVGDGGGISFSRAFAPSQGMVAGVEKPYREEICLDGSWRFQPVPVPADFHAGSGTPPDLASPQDDRWDAVPIKIPSPWNVNTWGNGRDAGDGSRHPYTADSVYYPSYPASWDGVEMGWLKRFFQVPAGWEGRRLILHFEAVAGDAQVFINGKKAGEHFDSYLPFDLDVTDLVRPQGDNELRVGIRKSRLFNIESPGYPPGQQRTYPNGSNTDNLVGIWQDVYLFGFSPVRVDDVFVQPQVDQDTLLAQVTLRNDTAQAQSVEVTANASPWINLAGTDVLSAPEPQWKLGASVLDLGAQTVSIPPGGTTVVNLQAPVAGKLQFWSPDAPHLYGLVVHVSGDGAKEIDRQYTRFGWRQFRISGRSLTLNGKPIQLFGDFGHPFGPFVGSRRYVWADYKMIKEMGGNAVRPHANVLPRIWTDLADEMGLCVLDESSIFGSSIALNLKAPITWQRFDSHVDGYVRRDRNHPSVFGWSVANEMFALFFKTDQADRDAEYAQLKELATRPPKLDPTRDWISMDGDKDLEGALPVWSRHIGIGLPEDLPDIDKPRMIGEQGGTYYAGPPLLEKIDGDHAFGSYADRNDALAMDLYRMVVEVARPKLAAFSPSELVWFGLEQLPFGYQTDARPPNLTDGIFFPHYVENVPGVQIERLPPYVMTLNPGFDPGLPAFRPMAMFPAMKAALDPHGPQPCAWDKIPGPTPLPPLPPPPSVWIDKIAFAGDAAGALYQSLQGRGVPLGNSGNPRLLVIDGETVSDAQMTATKALADKVSGSGGLVWVFVSKAGAALPRLTAAGILPAEIHTTPRPATSLVHGEPGAVMDLFRLSDLYFADQLGDNQIEKAGLDGDLVKSGRILLTASNTDWSLFQRQPESSKCSSMLIYEHLKKPPGTALVEIRQGAGRLWVSTLDPSPDGPAFAQFWTRLWTALDVKLGQPVSNWLVLAGRDGDSVWHYTVDTPASDWASPGFDDAAWKTGNAGFGTHVPNSEAKTPWTTGDIYLRRTFTVAKVPPSLRLAVHHDEDVEVYLNGTRVFAEKDFLTNYKNVVLPATAVKALHVGNNVIAVHCHQTVGGQFIDVGLANGGVRQGEHDLLLDGPTP